MSQTFDYESIAERLGIGESELAQLEDSVRAQYGSDEMMFELRMLRTLQAISDGATTLGQSLADFAADPRPPQTPLRAARRG